MKILLSASFCLYLAGVFATFAGAFQNSNRALADTIGFSGFAIAIVAFPVILWLLRDRPAK